ncbi:MULTISPECIES: hypothetical protein [Streptomyces]|uniref:Secreted protein n=1 Tax=Streptomyces cacaoi TaxID=1898 RepID=A0A4Y3QZL6_STRCI|nr:MULTISPECIES: hypothetical protein [Streptomyces]NNG88863.1 hypothetical protein [Streptomyces cacaoi]QHF92640.1 hypothetical protein DEH18_00505 [Streptomyces sp. NHF165]GEB50642.1 hypothetical protein SCA03_31930 [Streptomyces cacaoi]
MARTRTVVRLVSAAAAVPLAVTVLSGVAQADNGSFADEGANSNAADNVQVQNAEGAGNSTNNANNATVSGHGAVVDQDNETTNNTYTVVFNNLW